MCKITHEPPGCQKLFTILRSHRNVDDKGDNTMKRNNEKLASILLTMVMAMTLFFAAPMTVFGAANETAGDPTTFAAALANVDDGGTITLTGSFTYTGQVILSSKSFTIDLANYTLTVNTGGGAAVYIENGNVLTVKGPGTFDAIATAGGGISVDDGILLLESGAIFNVTAANSMYSAVTVEFGGIVTVSSATAASVGVDASDGSSVTVTGNVVATGANSIGAVAYSGSQITIDGTITVPATGTYVQIESVPFLKTDFVLPTTKAGYLTYTDGTSTVWVFGTPPPPPPPNPTPTPDPDNPGTPGGGSISSNNNVPQTSDINNTLGWTVVLALVFLGIFGLVMWRRRQRA